MGWYEESFGDDYLIVYKHRDTAGAYNEVQAMIGWLGLPQGAAVLDLCCGMGRHSMALADFGYRVTGVDLSGVLLAEAIRRDTQGRIEWVQGDMRHIPADGPFDAVVNLFTSFGYFRDDAENETVIREISRVLKSGGRFIIDFLNASYVQAHLVPHSVRREGDSLIEENRSVENGFISKRIAIREPGKPERQYIEQVKCYGLEQLETMAARAKLRIDRVYGGYDGRSYERDGSPRLILTGTKEGT
ncbi:class I SAM-dependent methyltransferase [Paenibacillus hemerocallicola]|uniref:Class I SAM-dependent methyltransferase n=1 Tax=Paenibacillus hemerocallicola TaxID=1172614 RepID=A0A5C4TC46_9BACL|nr:class I SAM-dependent methyltransferase [Paenibacillus hemerocallicola]TNJ66505.1 class I SAM-dependent methyltransferase [Paenibacillus hemerocallicola]